MTFRVYVGFDSREIDAYQVCLHSLRERASAPVDIEPLLEPHLRGIGLYRRRHERRNGRLWDTLSAAPMATEFAITRFLVPQLARTDWALFCDGDFLWRDDVYELLALADPRCAVMVVQHAYAPAVGEKMDGQIQLPYPRKNWSSLMLWNCRHPAHAPLAGLVNTWAGRRLHGFEWLDDSLIGALPEAWNWLEGHSSPAIDPRAVHFTRGTPDMAGYQDVPYAGEWRAMLGALGPGRAGEERQPPLFAVSALRGLATGAPAAASQAPS